jgi:pimeloyl-ACP methyl ester carboxylesterase
MKTYCVDAPGGPVTGVEVGTGPTVVLVAGLGSTSKIWGELPALLGRWFRVLAIDNRGVGGSRSGRRFSLTGAVEDVTAVLDAREVNRASIIGASMGGVIALEFASTHPDQVSRLVVASSAARLSSHGRRVLELFRDLMLYAPPERVGAALMTLAFAPPFHEQFDGFVRQASELYGLDEQDLPGTLVQLEELLDGWDLRDRLPSIAVPVMVLAGRRDPIVSVEDSRRLADALPDCEWVEVPDAAHSVLAEGGGELLDRVRRFLTGQPEDRSIV